MAIQLAQEKASTGTLASLCESCGNAVPHLCLFMSSEDAESALAAMGAEADKYVHSHQGDVFRVTACPNHVPGKLPRMTRELPRITKAKPAPKKFLDIEKAGYNVTCPHCGNTSENGVAGTYGLKIEEWYCRCARCGKSYRPRKREARGKKKGM